MPPVCKDPALAVVPALAAAPPAPLFESLLHPSVSRPSVSTAANPSSRTSLRFIVIAPVPMLSAR
jgi:hypothetical protein